MVELAFPEGNDVLDALLEQATKERTVVLTRGGHPILEVTSVLTVEVLDEAEQGQVSTQLQCLREEAKAHGYTWTWEEFKQFRDEGRP